MAIVFDVGFRLSGQKLDEAIKPSLSALSAEIDNAFQGASAKGRGLSKPILEAVVAANSLSAALQSATTNKGLSFTVMQQSLARSNTSVEQMVARLGSAGPAFSQSFNLALNSIATANRQVITLSSKLQEAARVFNQSFKFTMAQSAVRFISSTVNESISWVKELDSTLAQIATVTGKTGSALEKVYSDIIAGSQALRVAASDYAEASVIFYQQGLNDNEVQRRTEITIQAAKAANQSVETMASQLTAIWNSYNMIGEEQARAAAVGAKLAASTAVDFADIASAMQISAAAANQMGVSYDSLAAIVATVGDATQQSASIIGNAYKTIFARFQQLTTEGTDGEVTLNAVSSKLQSLGVHVLDINGKLRDLDDVIMETGSSWSTYSEEQQLAIAELVGGTRQYGQFLSLMQNFPDYLKNMKIATEETGETLITQFLAARNTIEAAAENSKEAWSRAMQSIFQADNMKEFYNKIEDAGKLVGDLIESFGGMRGILINLGFIFQQNISDKIRDWKIQLTDIVHNLTPQLAKINIGKENASQLASLQQANAQAGGNTRDNVASEVKLKGANELKAAMVDINRLINSSSAGAQQLGQSLMTAYSNIQNKLNSSVDKVTEIQAGFQDIETSLKQQGVLLENVEDTTSLLSEEERLQATLAQERLQSLNTELIGRTFELENLQREATLINITANEELNKLNLRQQELQVLIAMSEVEKTRPGVTDEEIAQINQRIAGYRNIITAIEGQKAAQNKLKSETNAAMKNIKNSYSEVQKQIELTKRELNELRKSGTQVKEIAKQTNQVAQGFQKFGSAIGDAMKDSENFKTHVIKGYREMIQSIPDQEMKKKMNEMFNPAEMQRMLQSADNDMSVFIAQFVAKITNFNNDPANKIKITIDEQMLLRMGASAEQARQAMEGLKNSSQGVGDATQKMGLKVQQGTADFAKFAINTLTVVNGLNSLVGAVMDGNVSFTTLLSTFVMVVPALINMVKSSALLTAAQGALASSHLVTAAAATVQAIAEALLGKALSDTAAAAIDSSIAMGVLLVAIVAVVAVISALAKAHEKELEQHRQLAEKKLEEAQATQEATNAIREEVNAFNEANTAIQKAVEGTDEFIEAQEKMEQAVDSVLQKLRDEAEGLDETTRAMLEHNLAVAKASGDYGQMSDAMNEANLELTKNAIKEFQAAKDAAGATFIDDMREGTGHFSGGKYIAQIGNGAWYDQWTGDEKIASDALAKGDYKHITKEADGNGGDLIIHSGQTAEEMIEAYTEALRLQKEMENLGSAEDLNNSEIYENLTDWLDKASEAYARYKDAVAGSVEQQQALFNMDPGMLIEILNLTDKFSESDIATLTPPKDGFKSLDEYDAWIEQLTRLKDAAGWTQEQMDELVYSNEAAVQAIAAEDKITNAVQDLKDAGAGSITIPQEMQTALTEAEAELKAAKNKFVWPWDGEGKKAKEEAIAVAQAKVDAAQQAIDEESALQEAALKEYQDKAAAAEDLLREKYEYLASQGLEEYFGNLEFEITFDTNLEELDKELDQQIRRIQALDKNAKYRDVISGENMQKYSERQKIADGISKGDTISAEDYEKLGEAYNNYFRLMEDGTYQLIEDAEKLKESVEYERKVELGENAIAAAQNAQDYANTEGADSATVAQLNQSSIDIQSQLLNSADSLTELNSIFGELSANMQDVGGASYTAFAEALIGLATQFDNTTAEVEAYQQALINGDAAQIEAAESALQLATYVGESAEKYGLSAESVEIQAKQLAKAYGLTAEQAAKTAIANQRMNKGINTLHGSFKKWKTILKSVDKTSQDYADTVAELTPALADLVGAADGFEIPDGFLDMPENMDLIEKAAEGDQNAINQLGVKFAQAQVSALQFNDSMLSMMSWTQEDMDIWGTPESKFNHYRDTVLAGITTLQGKLGELEAGASLADALGSEEAGIEWVTALNEMAIATGMSVEEMNGLLNELGVQATVTTADVPQVMQVPTYIEKVEPMEVPSTNVNADGTPSTEKRTEWVHYTVPGPSKTVTGTVQVAQIDTGDNPSAPDIKQIKWTGTGGGNASGASPTANGTNPVNNDGSTGSGGKNYVNDADPKEAKEEEHRYENIDSSIEDLTRTLEKLNAAENDAWGAQKRKNLRAINYELAQQNKLLSIRLKEAKGYYFSDFDKFSTNADVNAAGFNASNISRNKDGTINNSEQIRHALFNLLVQPFIDAENALIGSTDEEAVKAAQKATEEAQKRFDEAEEQLDKVNESAKEYADTLQRMVDALREMMSNMLSEIQDRLDIQIGIKERDLNRLEKLINRWGDLGVINGKTYDLLNKNLDNYYDQMQIVTKEIQNSMNILDMLDDAKNGDQAAYDQIVGYFGLDDESKKAFDEYLAGTGALPAEFADFLLDLRSQLEDLFESTVDDVLEQLNIIFQQVENFMEKTLESWQNIMDQNSAMMDFYDTVMEFTGAYSANDLSYQQAGRTIMTGRMSEAQAQLDYNIASYNMYDQAIAAANAALERIRSTAVDEAGANTEYWENRLKDAQAAKKKAIEAGDEAAELAALTDETEARMWLEFGAGAEAALTTQIETWRSEQQSLLSEITSSAAELLNVATENIEKEKEFAKKNVGTILNGLFSDLDDFVDNYSRVKEAEAIEFDDYDQTYMTNQLQRQYDDFAENADAASLQELAAWQEKLNQYKETTVRIDENGNKIVEHKLKMTQDEYDLLQKEFELAQLKAQWEEQQNNKNTMRLTRDASGNYNYVYSSDNTAEGDDLQSQMEQKEYEYKKLLESIQDSTIETVGQLGVELQNTMDEINWQLWETDEVYRQSMTTKLEALMSQLSKYGAASDRIFNDLAVGVGDFGSVWDSSAAAIVTQSESLPGYIKKMADALIGDGDLDHPDSSTYLGKVLSAQQYWANEANNALKDSVKNMAESGQGSIPNEFGIITTAVLSEINKISSMDGESSSAYSVFVTNSQTLQEQINALLNGPANSVYSAYKDLKSGANTLLNGETDSVKWSHNELARVIKEVFGVPGQESNDTIFGKYAQMKSEMQSVADKTNENLNKILASFTSWATSSCQQIQKVIDSIKEYIAMLDQKEDAEGRAAAKEAEETKPFTQITEDEVPNVDPGLVTSSSPSGPTTGTPSTPSTGGGMPSLARAEEVYALINGGKLGNGVNPTRINEAAKLGYTKQELLLGQALINARYPKNLNGMGYGWTQKAIDWAQTTGYQNLVNKHGAYTGGLFSEPTISSLAEKGPELVLNAEDTQKILEAVQLVRQQTEQALAFRDLQTTYKAAQQEMALSAMQAEWLSHQQEALEQQVHIEASFPGVSVAQEIEDALNSLITQAAQYNIKR